MNKMVATLATTTVLFAGSTVYFWQKSQTPAPAVSTADSPTRESPPPLASRDSPAANITGVPRPAASIPNSPAAAAPSAAARGAQSGHADPAREMILPFAKDWLRQYDNPEQRASLLKAARAGIEAQYSRLRTQLKLDPNTFNQLVDILTQEQLEQQSNYFRCVVDASCNPANVRPPPDHSDEYLALLGADGLTQFNSYREALPEWQAVIQLRGRLGESNYLRDGDAERLLGALSAEHKAFMVEANQSGAKLRGWGMGTGMIWYSGDGGLEEQLASATQYSERMRRRAASVLTAEQLKAFAQIQDELLANFANYLRSQSGQS